MMNEQIQKLAELAGAKFFKDKIVVADNSSSGNATNFVPLYTTLIVADVLKTMLDSSFGDEDILRACKDLQSKYNIDPSFIDSRFMENYE